MIKEFFPDDAAKKVDAICWGLVTTDVVLLVAYLIGLDQKIGAIFFDDYFLGLRTSLFLTYFIDIAILSFIILFLHRELNGGFLIGLFWGLLNFLETVFDISYFWTHPHFIAEEFMFLAIYFFMCYLCATVVFPNFRIFRVFKEHVSIS